MCAIFVPHVPPDFFVFSFISFLAALEARAQEVAEEVSRQKRARREQDLAEGRRMEEEERLRREEEKRLGKR